MIVDGFQIINYSVNSLSNKAAISLIANGVWFLVEDTNTIYFKISDAKLNKLCTADELVTVVGPAGKDGKDGLPGTPGKDGTNGTAGKDGKDLELINVRDNSKLKIWVGSSAQLALVEVQDPSTVYIIKE